MATQRSIVDVLLLRRLLMLCVATTFALSWHTCSTPLFTLAPSPSSNVRFYRSRSLGRATRRVRDSAAPTEFKGYYKQNELGGAARAHGPGRIKTCGLSPIYNNIVIIGHRETICPRGSRRETILVAPGSCPEPSCYSQIRLAVVKHMSFQIKIVVVHRRDKLLLEMTEEYMIYHGELRALQRLW